jgi:hypothetical protein
LQKLEDSWIQFPFLRQPLLQRFEFIVFGQPSEPEQVADFLESRMIRKVVNVIPAIGENSLIAIDVANAGGSCDYPFQSFGAVGSGDTGHVSSLAGFMSAGCLAKIRA